MKFAGAVRVAGFGLVGLGMASIAAPAAAQGRLIERTLAGVKLNSASRVVLSKFGNPNEIYIGDIGVRVPGTTAGGGAAAGDAGIGAPGGGMGAMMGGGGPMMGGMAGPGGSSMMGSMMGAGGGGGKMSAMGSTGPAAMGGGGSSMMSSMMGSMMGGSRMGAMAGGGGGMMGSGAMGRGPGGRRMGGMMGGGKMGGDGEAPAMPSPGGGGMGAMMGAGAGGAGGGVGAFGRSESLVSKQQEVTWVFNRLVKDTKGQNTAVSYEFLINPSGSVSQIRCLGYQSPRRSVPGTPGINTERGIRLGSSYSDILKAYGQPETYEKVGNVLVLSYPRRHVQFQLVNQQEQNSPVKAAYKVIASTIATVEG